MKNHKRVLLGLTVLAAASSGLRAETVPEGRFILVAHELAGSATSTMPSDAATDLCAVPSAALASGRRVGVDVYFQANVPVRAAAFGLVADPTWTAETWKTRDSGTPVSVTWRSGASWATSEAFEPVSAGAAIHLGRWVGRSGDGGATLRLTAPSGGETAGWVDGAGTLHPVEAGELPVLVVGGASISGCPGDMRAMALLAGGGEVRLGAPAPNPMRGSTRIQYYLPNASNVRLELFDLQGRKVRALVDGMRSAGVHEVDWDGTSDERHALSQGMYFYRLQADGREVSSSVMLLK